MTTVILKRASGHSANCPAAFPHWRTAEREFFGAWRVDIESGDLHGVYDESVKDSIYNKVLR